MTCEHCCGADTFFNEKEARKQLKRYRKKGPRKTSYNLIQGIKSIKNGSNSLLDIGGGIGVVHLEMIKDGISRVTNIDASSSYLKLARDESERQNVQDKINYFQGDFLDEQKTLNKHDIVVLDKVICCYPYMPDLLNASINNSNKILALVYPKSNILGKIIFAMGNITLKIKGNPFRIFLHSNQNVRNKIEKAGFHRVFYKTVYLWNVEVYERTN